MADTGLCSHSVDLYVLRRKKKAENPVIGNDLEHNFVDTLGDSKPTVPYIDGQLTPRKDQ